MNPKENYFDHIVYVMNMYISTYYDLCEFWDKKIVFDQYEYNKTFEIHCVNLRILLEFFNNGKNCITQECVLGKDFKSLHITESKLKQPINKSVSHLCEERVKNVKELSESQKNEIPRIYPVIISKIEAFLSLLEINKQSISDKYKTDFDATETKKLLSEIKQRLDKNRGPEGIPNSFYENIKALPTGNWKS